MASVLVVKPKTLNAADKKLLREEGIVCVDAADPSSVRLLQLEGQPLGGNDLFYAAIKSIAADRYNGNTAEHFAKALAAMAKATTATQLISRPHKWDVAPPDNPAPKPHHRAEAHHDRQQKDRCRRYTRRVRDYLQRVRVKHRHCYK